MSTYFEVNVVHSVKYRFNFFMKALIMSSTTTAVSVVKQNEVLTKESIEKIDDFVSRYQDASQKSAVAVIELARVIADAYDRTKMTQKELDQFLIKIDCVSTAKQSYLAKMRRIGDSYNSRFKDLMTALPCAYTTLYKLTQLQDEEFAYLKDNQLICTELSALKVNEYVKKYVASIASDVVADAVDAIDDPSVDESLYSYESHKSSTFVIDFTATDFQTSAYKKFAYEFAKLCEKYDLLFDQINTSDLYKFSKNKERLLEQRNKVIKRNENEFLTFQEQHAKKVAKNETKLKESSSQDVHSVTYKKKVSDEVTDVKVKELAVA